MESHYSSILKKPTVKLSGGHTCHDLYFSLAASVLHVCLERAPSGVEPVTLWTNEDFLLAVWNVVTCSVTVHIRLVAKAERALVTLKKNTFPK